MYVAVNMPRNPDVCTAYLYVWRMCGVSLTLFSYLRRISDVLVSVAYVLPTFRCCMCDVLGVLGIFCGVPRES